MSKGPGGQFILPPIKWRETPNRSSRPGGIHDVHGIIVHDTEGGYAGSVSWLCNTQANASAHIVLREDGNEATQLVRWGEKAWHAVAANQHFLGLEMAGFLNREGSDEWHTAARICAYWCHKYRIPPVWNVRHTNPFGPGLARHLDLGAAGGGHHDPTTNEQQWIWFVFLVQHEVTRGGFLESWGRE